MLHLRLRGPTWLWRPARLIQPPVEPSAKVLHILRFALIVKNNILPLSWLLGSQRSIKNKWGGKNSWSWKVIQLYYRNNGISRSEYLGQLYATINEVGRRRVFYTAAFSAQTHNQTHARRHVCPQVFFHRKPESILARIPRKIPRSQFPVVTSNFNGQSVAAHLRRSAC